MPVVVSEFEDLLRRDQQAPFVEPGLVAEPCQDYEKRRRGWSEARATNVHCGAEPGLVDIHGLDLKPDHASGGEVEYGDLGRLEVRKRAEQVQGPGFRQTTGDLGFTEVTQIAPPLRTRLRCRTFQPLGGNSETLGQAL